MLRIGPEPTDNEISTINIRQDNKRIGILKNPNGKYSLDVSGTINCGALTVNGIRATFDGTNSGLWSISDTDTISYVNGSVGIGTEEPAHELDVSGSVNCSELLVNGTAPTFGGEYVLYDDTYQTSGVSYEEVSANITTTTSSGVWDLSDSNTISYTNGNVGIGTTSPSELLTIQSASATDATFSVITQEESDNAIIYLGTPHNSGQAIKCAIIAEGQTNWSTSNLHFCLNNDTGDWEYNDSSYSATLSDSRMVITPAGYVGIGTTDPVYELDVSGDVGINGSLRIGGTRDVSQFMENTDYSACFENYIYAPAIINYAEVGTQPAGIVFGDTSANGTDEISLITDGVTRVYINSSGVSLRNGNGNSSYDKAQIAFGHNNTNNYQHFIQTRHNGSGSSGNAIDFFVCDTTVENSANNGVTHTMSLDGGKVGIGTTSPIAPLHIVEATDAYLQGGPQISYMISTGVIGPVYSGSEGNLAIYTSGKVVAASFVAGTGFSSSSDSRIKTNITDISDNQALYILNQLQPKRYGYRDVISRGTSEVLGFIAQEVAEVIPSAVQLNTEYIPNIYQLATVSGEILTFSTDISLSSITDVSSGKVKIYDIHNKEHFIDISSATDTTMTLSNPSQITDEMQYENQIFVYGEEVSDFNYLKKDTIIPVAVGAIQELDRQLIQLKQEKDALQASHDSLQASHDSLQASHDSLKDEMAELKALLQEKSVI